MFICRQPDESLLKQPENGQKPADDTDDEVLAANENCGAREGRHQELLRRRPESIRNIEPDRWRP
jgi:hypothetical protein